MFTGESEFPLTLDHTRQQTIHPAIAGMVARKEEEYEGRYRPIVELATLPNTVHPPNAYKNHLNHTMPVPDFHRLKEFPKSSTWNVNDPRTSASWDSPHGLLQSAMSTGLTAEQVAGTENIDNPDVEYFREQMQG